MLKKIVICCLCMVLCFGCDSPMQENTSEVSNAVFSAKGWPAAVDIHAVEIVISPSTETVLVGTVSLYHPSGESDIYFPEYHREGHTYSIYPKNLLSGKHYSINYVLMSADGTQLSKKTNFQTKMVNTSIAPVIRSCWPDVNSGKIINQKSDILLQYSEPVDTGNITIMLYDGGSYYYPMVKETGYSASLTIPLQDYIQPGKEYQVFITGVRNSDGIYGESKWLYFSTAVCFTDIPLPGRLLFSQICISYPGYSNNVEFLEFYNPYPYPLDIATNSFKLYRRTKNTWTLICDFSNPEHFTSSSGVPFISGYGYFLLANQQAFPIIGNRADRYISDSKLTITGKEEFILMFNGTPKTGKLIDSVGFDAVMSNGIVFRTDTTVFIRKAIYSATSQEMVKNAALSGIGNSFDSGIHSNDFVTIPDPYPRWSGSPSGIPKGM